MRSIVPVAVGVAVLVAAVAFFAWQLGRREGARDEAVDESPRAEIPLADARESQDFSAAAVRVAAHVERNAVEHAPESSYAQPTEIEHLILQTIAERRPSVLSINSVKCGATTCEIAFTGTDINPRVIDAQENLSIMLLASERWRDFRILSGGMGTREISPGAREYVIGFTYQPLVDLSDDPRIAARQQAACAAAWRRQTTNPTPAEYVRQYLAIAEQHLALAAAELGREEAERLARETNLGPLIRECRLQPPPP